MSTAAESAWIVGNFGEVSPKRFEAWLRSSVGSYTLEEIGGGYDCGGSSGLLEEFPARRAAGQGWIRFVAHK